MQSHTTQKVPKSDDRVDLLSEYTSWSSPDYPNAELLQQYLEHPSKSLWLQACYQAVKDENRNWLENPPLDRVYPRINDEDRKKSALFISNCALKALLTKQSNGLNNTNETDLQDIMNDAHVGNESVIDLIQHFISEKRLSEVKQAAVKVLLAGNEGKLGQLEIEKVPNGEGKIFSDPAIMAFSKFEKDFEESIKTALKYITDSEGIEEAQKYNYRWRLLDISDTKKEDNNFRVFDQPLRGSSMGFASALAFLQLFNRINFSLKKYAFTGKIDENGVLKSVGGYREKLDKSEGLTVYCPASDYEKIKHQKDLGRSIRKAITVWDAIADIKDRNRKEQTRRFRNRALALIFPLTIVVLAVAAWTYRTNAEIARKEANAERLQKESAQSEANSINQKLEAQKIETDSERRLKEAETLEKENALNAEKLAEEKVALEKEQSKVLAQKNQQLAQKNTQLDEKNVQLDKAKQIAENNEKEADFQKSVAEKNEEAAKAYQQVAQANQLAYQGLSSLNDKDYLSAQTYFAESLSFNDTNFARSGLLKTAFGNPIDQKFKWFLDQRTTSSETALEIGAEEFFYRLSLEPTGEFFAYPLNEKEISLRKVKTSEEVEKLTVNGDKLEVFSLSPGGKYLAIGTSDGNLVLRNNSSKKEETLLKVETIPDGKMIRFTAIAFNSDGSYLAVATGNKEIIVVDLDKKKLINTFPKKPDNEKEKVLFDEGVLNLAFNSSNGLAFSTINDEFDSQIGFIPDVKKDLVLTAPNEGVIAKISFTNDNQLISSGMGWKTWSIKEKNIEESASEQIAAHPQTFSVSNQNFDYFISLSGDGRLKFWNLENQNLLAQISQSMGMPFQIALADNGMMLVQSVDKDGKVKIFCWELKKSKDNQLIPSNANEDIKPELISYNGNYVDFDCSKRLLNVKNLFSKKIILSIQFDPSDNIRYLDLTPKLNKRGTYLLLKAIGHEKIKGFSDGRVRVNEKLSLYNLSNFQKTEVDVSKYREPNRSTIYNFGSVSSFCSQEQQTTVMHSDIEEYISDDGKVFALSTKDDSIAIFSTDDVSKPISIISNKINSNVSLPANDNFAAGFPSFSISQNNQTLIRSVPTMVDIIEHKQTMERLNLEASGYSFELYDTQTGSLKQVIPSPDGLLDFSLSPNGKFFAITDIGGNVYLWKLEPYRRLINVLKTNNYERALSPAFSQDSKLLAWTSVSTGRIHFYDLENQKMLADWLTDDLVGAVNFADNNKLSILTFRGLNTIDFSSFPFLSLKDAPSIKDFVRSQTNVFLGYPQNTSVFYDQTKLNSILEANKYKLDNPKFFGGSEQSNEITEFNNDFEIRRSDKIDNRYRGFDCRPVFYQPIFNPYSLTFNDDRSPCAHYPLIDIRKVGEGETYSQNQQQWESTRQIDLKDIYYGLIYVSNGAAKFDGGDIRNVKVRVTITALENGGNTMEAVLMGDNASSLTGSLKLQTVPGKKIIIGNTIEFFDNQAEFLKTIELSNVKKEDNKTVFEIPVGDLNPGFETDLFIRFNFAFDRKVLDSIPKEKTTSSVSPLGRFLVKTSNKNCKPSFPVPIFNPFPIAFQDPPEECKDFPLIEGRIDNGKYPQNINELQNGVTVRSGDTVNVLVYFDNGASENLSRSLTTIKNFKVATLVDTAVGDTHKISVTLSGDNIKPLRGNLIIHTGENEKLETVAGSGVLFDFRTNAIQSGFDVGNNILNMQDLLAGFIHSGFIRFGVKVVKQDKSSVSDQKTSTQAVVNLGHEIIRNCKPAYTKPIFNPYPLTFKSPAEFCSNYPLIDIRKADGKYSQNQEEWESVRQIAAGENYYGLLYLSNGAANNLSSEEADIRNVRIKITINISEDGTHLLEATLTADNTSSLSANVKLQTATQKQIVVGDTIEIFNYKGKFPPIRTINKSDIFREDGEKTVFEIPIGNLKPGFKTDLFIRFSFSVK